MPGLLYPAYQKLYGALSNLERFNKEKNFFDNISALDGFFSEYRNITFALQAQVKHTGYFSAYEKNRDLFLQDHWFIDKRNETTKQHPFQLVKRIDLTVYLPHLGIPLFEKEYSVENDEPFESLFPELKEAFSEIREAEIFFSVSFSFHEKNSDVDLFDKLFSGISSMLKFMDAMEHDIGENCTLCNQLKEKISKVNLSIIPRDLLLTNDYVYYPHKDAFDRGSRITMMLSNDGKSIIKRYPIAVMVQRDYYNYDGTPFNNFTFMHAVLRCIQPGMDIMTAIMIVYNDDTYDMDVFHADIKTTVYRKINETAKIVCTQDVREVYYASLYAFIPLEKHVPITSKERLDTSNSDVLVCACIDDHLNEKEYVFDGKAMEQPEYVINTMKSGMRNSLNVSRYNLCPVWSAFKNKQQL